MSSEAEPKKLKFTADMTCGGCESAVKKNLGKLDQTKVTAVETDVATKTVIVTTTLDSKEILEQLNKTGLNPSFVGVV